MAEPADIIKRSCMVKRSINKRRMGPVNYKARVFILTNRYLSYHDGDSIERPGKEKGKICIHEITVIEEVDESAFAEKNRGYPFQVCWNDYVLYVFTHQKSERDDWVSILQNMCRDNRCLLNKYHNGMFSSSTWSCCGQTARLAPGCQEAFKSRIRGGRRNRDSSPLPSTPENVRFSRQPVLPPPAPPPRPPEIEKDLRVVVALYPYTPTQQGDLALVKGDEYTVLDDSREHWWKAKNSRGEVGHIPSNFVQEQKDYTNMLTKFDWYSSEVSRSQAEEDLKAEDKEGCFIVRNSSTAGMYTLSVYSKDGVIGMSDGFVRHYHIKKNDQGYFYMSDKHSFPTIPELIDYHQHNSGGLATRLRKPPKSYNTAPATVGLGHDIWEIDPAEITLMKELGGGQFGIVRLGKLNNGTYVAVKMMRENAMSEDDFIDEARVMQQLKHEHLVQLYGVCSKSRPLYIITEYMNKGCLLNYLRYRQYLLDKPLQLLDMCKQVCSAMVYLESKSFIHRDLAARNCLVGDRTTVKVCDFGLTRFVIDDDYTSSGGSKFPIKWAPPEVLHYTKFSSKSDIWAFGILMWEVFTAGKMPYPNMSNVEVVNQVSSRGYRLERPSNCPESVYTIMMSCWEEEPDRRPAFRVVIRQIQKLAADDYQEWNI
ncbi:tyrosine-protein kinase BTK-like [Saccoglossus kowalevskii]|uniref:Tyrosine-protein kinase n=1 Tax=Saccoglossus kowalevskii TaxID=10224 RepID=A0ABM0GNS8_SACKO|nr:PREDICTED: tyrosine-protein kinase BTK-like [Saccoglossus kowalevskii]